MEKPNEVSTDDKIKEEIEVKVEDDPKEPVKAETEGKGEETPLKNETPKQESPGEKRSAGEVIANLGNEKKDMASKLVALAKTNDDARKEVREMLLNDPATAGYLKSKFGEDYDSIVGDKPLKEDTVDVVKIREQERVKAQAEAITAQMQSTNEKMLEEKAKELGFTSDEFETFKSKVELLGGGESAVRDAALIVNQVKATANKGEYSPEGGEADKPVTKQVTITPGLNDFSKGQGLDQKDFASGIARVKDLHQKDVHGRDVMSLPGL